MKKGQRIQIAIGLLANVAADVAWVRGDLAGLRFAQPIQVDAAKTRPKPIHLQQGWGTQAR